MTYLLIGMGVAGYAAYRISQCLAHRLENLLYTEDLHE